MKKLLKKKVNVFGKGIPVLAIFVLGIALVSAALIPYFAQITGLVTVSQGLLVDGQEYSAQGITDTYAAMTSLENRVFVSAHRLSNDATVDAEVSLVKSCLQDDIKIGCDATDEPTVNYYETNLRAGSLELARKTIDNTGKWIPSTSDRITINYETNEDGKFVVTSHDVPKEYTLIYYVDDEFMSDEERLATPGDAYKIDGNFAIPYSDDGNLIGEVDYCDNELDDYLHCKGAKIWAIRTVDIPVDGTIVWHANWQTEYYFETDLLGWNPTTALPSPVTVPATNGVVDFVIVSDFPKMLIPAKYTITTTVDTV